MRNVCAFDTDKDGLFMCIIKEKGDKVEKKFGVLTLVLDRLPDIVLPFCE